jgi:hypothetical protein
MSAYGARQTATFAKTCTRTVAVVKRAALANVLMRADEVRANHIDYWDDTGFIADGEFKDRILYHAGMMLFRGSTVAR